MSVTAAPMPAAAPLMYTAQWYFWADGMTVGAGDYTNGWVATKPYERYQVGGTASCRRGSGEALHNTAQWRSHISSPGCKLVRSTSCMAQVAATPCLQAPPPAVVQLSWHVARMSS